MGGPDAFQGVGLSFSSTVWAFEFVDFSAFSCQDSGLATLGRPDLGRRKARQTLVVFQVGLSAETFSAGSGLRWRAYLWATARLVNFSPMFFEFVWTVCAAFDFDFSAQSVFGVGNQGILGWPGKRTLATSSPQRYHVDRE